MKFDFVTVRQDSENEFVGSKSPSPREKVEFPESIFLHSPLDIHGSSRKDTDLVSFVSTLCISVCVFVSSCTCVCVRVSKDSYKRLIPTPTWTLGREPEKTKHVVTQEGTSYTKQTRRNTTNKNVQCCFFHLVMSSFLLHQLLLLVISRNQLTGIEVTGTYTLVVLLYTERPQGYIYGSDSSIVIVSFSRTELISSGCKSRVEIVFNKRIRIHSVTKISVLELI